MAKATFDRVPPANVEAERAVLGAMLLNSDVVDEVIPILAQADLAPFYVEAHALLFSAIVGLRERGAPVDMVSLTSALTASGKLEASGGAAYIAELTDAVPTSANAVYYAGLVREAALLRGLITICSRAAGDGYRGEADAALLIDQVAAALDGLGAARVHQGVHSIAGLIPEAVRQMEAIVNGTAPKGLPTGIGELDRILGGLQRQDLVIVAASPSTGKTALVLNFALAAAGAGYRVIVFSAEMDRRKIMQRLLCAAGRVDHSRLKSGFLARAEIPKLSEAVKRLNGMKIGIDDTPNPTIMQVRASARRWARSEGGADLVIIDYFQLLTSGARVENRNLELGEVSRHCKGLARELDATVVLLSQINREGQKAESPQSYHIRDSSAPEADADVLIMLSRVELKAGGDGLQLDVRKQRNGPTGRVYARFVKTEQWIGDVDPGSPQPVDYGEPMEEYYEEQDALF